MVSQIAEQELSVGSSENQHEKYRNMRYIKIQYLPVIVHSVIPIASSDLFQVHIFINPFNVQFYTNRANSTPPVITSRITFTSSWAGTISSSVSMRGVYTKTRSTHPQHIQRYRSFTIKNGRLLNQTLRTRDSKRILINRSCGL